MKSEILLVIICFQHAKGQLIPTAKPSIINIQLIPSSQNGSASTILAKKLPDNAPENSNNHLLHQVSRNLLSLKQSLDQIQSTKAETEARVNNLEKDFSSKVQELVTKFDELSKVPTVPPPNVTHVDFHGLKTEFTQQIQLLNISNTNFLNAFQEKLTSHMDKFMSTVQTKNDIMEDAIRKLHTPTQGKTSLIENRKFIVVETLKPLDELSEYDCCELRKRGFNETRNYRIKINNHFLYVECDMTTDGGGWTVIQKRTQEGPIIGFSKNWESYEEGFGNPQYSYWIGIGNIAILTKNYDQQIRFDMESFNSTKGKAYANYQHFHITGPEDKYRLTIDNYSGTAGDSMRSIPKNLNGMQFSTFDIDNDKIAGNCAKDFKAGFWHNNCFNANPNGVLHPKEVSSSQSLFWTTFHSSFSLKSFEMKVRNKSPVLCGIS